MNALLLGLALAAGGAGKGRLVGHVFDLTGMPLAAVKVTARAEGRARIAYSNAQGAFSLTELPPGPYAVELTAPKLKAVRQAVSVPPAAPAELTVVMEVDQLCDERIIRCPPLMRTTVPEGKPPEELVRSMPLWPRGRLVIHEDGQRDLQLAASFSLLEGEVRGAGVKVVVRRTELAGHLAGEPVWIWTHGREARGHIGGHDVAFWLHETPAGHLLRGQGVGPSRWCRRRPAAGSRRSRTPAWCR